MNMKKWKISPEKEIKNQNNQMNKAILRRSTTQPIEESKSDNNNNIIDSRRKTLSVIPYENINPTKTGASWTLIIESLRNSGSSFEAISYIRELEVMLTEISAIDRIAFCKADFELTLQTLQNKPSVYTTNLMKECTRMIITYFDEDKINKLPDCILHQIFVHLPAHKFNNILTTCKNWHRVGTSKGVWQDLYCRRFGISYESTNNYHKTSGEIEETSHISLTTLRQSSDCMVLYRSRIISPMIWDKIEVMWRGKFRLDDDIIYTGLAWWTAQIVDRRDRHYKVRYPGWSDRWEEWIPRSKIRWVVCEDLDTEIKPMDIVEVWCSGRHVPGVWLLCQVKKIKRGKYGFEHVCSTGTLWVERNRIRPVEVSSLTRSHVKIRDNIKTGQHVRNFMKNMASSLSNSSCIIS